MNSSKLIILLKSLNKQEAERFALFLSSPLFNERETLTRLYEEVIKFYPHFNDKDLTRENLYQTLYKDKPYNEKLMRNLASRLYKKLEEYLSFLNYEKDPNFRRIGILNELYSRRIEDLHLKKINEFKKINESEASKTTDTFLNRHLLALHSSSHFFMYRRTPDTDNNILQERERNLIEYFIADILKIYSFMANSMTMYPEKGYKFAMLDEIVSYLQKNNEVIQNNFYIGIYLNNVMLSLKNKDKYYFELKRILNENYEKLPRSEKGHIYTRLHNYLQEKIFKGDKGSITEKFELYKESFANEGAYYDEKYIDHTTLIVAVSNALTLKEYEAAAEFISLYAGELNDFYKKSTELYCHALIEYYRKNYGKALLNLSCVYLEDFSFKILVRTLLLMIYFSKNDFEGFSSITDSFRHYLDNSLKNKKTSEYYYSLYMNLINYASRLFKGRDEADKFDLDGFKIELINKPYIAKKQWLLEMIEEIENKKEPPKRNKHPDN